MSAVRNTVSKFQCVSLTNETKLDSIYMNVNE